jgi:hypothetical protein
MPAENANQISFLIARGIAPPPTPSRKGRGRDCSYVL